MKPPFSYVPALSAALGIMAGIILYYLLAPLWCIPAIAIAVGIICFFLRQHWFTFLFIFAAFGWAISVIDQPDSAPDGSLDVKAEWRGEITDLYLTSSASRLTVRLDSLDNRPVRAFKCAVLLPTPSERFSPGDNIAFKARLYNPDLTTDIPDEIRFNPTYFVDGITAQANVAPDDIILRYHTPSLKRTANAWRDEITDLIYSSPVSSTTAWFLAATLIGDDSMLDPSLVAQFRATGAAHYLALSGFHIGIVAMIASFALFPLKIWTRWGRLRHLLVIILMWLYAFTCGLAPSLVRAAVLISIFLFAKVIQRQSSPYNSLCIAALVILIFSPRQLFAPGFQMSFAAVLSILAFSAGLNPVKDRRSRLYNLAAFITVPVAAMLGTCLITMVHFHRFPLLFLIPNLILAILLPLLLGIGVILIISTAIHLKLTFLGIVADYIYLSISRICQLLADIPSSEIQGIFLSVPSIIAGAVSISLLAIALNYKHRGIAILAAVSLAIAVLFQITRPGLPASELYITRHPRHTEILIRDRDSAIIFTTARPDEHSDIGSQLRFRYANYLARRRCSTSIAVTDTDFTLPHCRMLGRYLIFHDKLLYFPTPNDIYSSSALRPDYLVATRSAGNRICEIIRKCSPDTVLISRDVPTQRTIKIIDFCQTNAIPHISLHDRPFSLIIPND